MMDTRVCAISRVSVGCCMFTTCLLFLGCFVYTYSSLSCISYLIYYGFGGVWSFILKKRPVFPAVQQQLRCRYSPISGLPDVIQTIDTGLLNKIANLIEYPYPVLFYYRSRNVFPYVTSCSPAGNIWSNDPRLFLDDILQLKHSFSCFLNTALSSVSYRIPNIWMAPFCVFYFNSHTAAKGKKMFYLYLSLLSCASRKAFYDDCLYACFCHTAYVGSSLNPVVV